MDRYARARSLTHGAGGERCIANLLAAGSMAFFFVLSHREQAWEKIKHAAHLA